MKKYPKKSPQRYRAKQELVSAVNDLYSANDPELHLDLHRVIGELCEQFREYSDPYERDRAVIDLLVESGLVYWFMPEKKIEEIAAILTADYSVMYDRNQHVSDESYFEDAVDYIHYVIYGHHTIRKRHIILLGRLLGIPARSIRPNWEIYRSLMNDLVDMGDRVDHPFQLSGDLTAMQIISWFCLDGVYRTPSGDWDTKRKYHAFNRHVNVFLVHIATRAYYREHALELDEFSKELLVAFATEFPNDYDTPVRLFRRACRVAPDRHPQTILAIVRMLRCKIDKRQILRFLSTLSEEEFCRAAKYVTDFYR